MIVLITGSDGWRARAKLEELKQQFLKKYKSDGAEIVTTDCAHAAVGEIKQAVLGGSLFASKKLIVLKNFSAIRDNKESAAEVLRRGGPDRPIIIVEETESKNLKHTFLPNPQFKYEFNALSGHELVSWVKNQAKRQGANLDDGATAKLIEFYGNDSWALHNEISKLAAIRKEKLTIKDVLGAAHGASNGNIFTLIDALAERDRALASSLLRREIETADDLAHIASLFARQIRIMLSAKNNRGGREAAGSPLPSFVLAKAGRQAARWRTNELKNVIERLLVFEKNFKTGSTDPKTAFALLVASC